MCPSKCRRRKYSKIKNCAQASANGGIIQKFEFRHLIFEASKETFGFKMSLLDGYQMNLYCFSSCNSIEGILGKEWSGAYNAWI